MEFQCQNKNSFYSLQNAVGSLYFCLVLGRKDWILGSQALECVVFLSSSLNFQCFLVCCTEVTWGRCMKMRSHCGLAGRGMYVKASMFPAPRNLSAGLIAFKRLLHPPRNQLVSEPSWEQVSKELNITQESCLDESWYLLLTQWTAPLRVFSKLHVSRVR